MIEVLKTVAESVGWEFVVFVLVMTGVPLVLTLRVLGLIFGTMWGGRGPATGQRRSVKDGGEARCYRPADEQRCDTTRVEHYARDNRGVAKPFGM